VASHIVIGHDESGAVHLYQFASKEVASDFMRQVKDLADIFWEQYIMETSNVREALESIKKYNEPTTLEKAQRYAMGECLEHPYHEYSYEQACKIVAYPETNQDKDGYTIIFPCEGLEDADLVLIMDMMVKAYMEGAK
jgi:hypothetical protein